MEKGDMALWYSSSAGKVVSGTMQVKDRAFTDKTNVNWLAIDFIPETSLPAPVSLKKITESKVFTDSNILKQKRISVIEITKEEYDEILEFSKEKINQPSSL